MKPLLNDRFNIYFIITCNFYLWIATEYTFLYKSQYANSVDPHSSQAA